MRNERKRREEGRDVRRSRQLSHAGSFLRFVPIPEVEGAGGGAVEVDATGGDSEDMTGRGRVMVGEVGGGGKETFECYGGIRSAVSSSPIVNEESPPRDEETRGGNEPLLRPGRWLWLLLTCF